MLNIKEKKQLELIKSYMESILGGDKTGHSIDHITRVVEHAKSIANTETCDLFIVLASAYLHDVINDKIIENTTDAHKQLDECLLDIEVNKRKKKQIFSVIENISYRKEALGLVDFLSHEAKIVQDADRLEALGAMGIIRTIYYGGVKSHTIYDSSIPARKFNTKEEYRQGSTVINHFYEKLLKIYKGLHTDYAKKVGKERHEFLLTFLQQFYQEWVDTQDKI